MLLITANEVQFAPFVDLVHDEQLKEPLVEAIEEFIIENKQRAVIGKKIVDIFHLSGLNQYNHEHLAEYLNRYILRPYHKDLAEVKRGQFANNKNHHFWIKIGGNIIIDLSIKKLEQESSKAQKLFKDKYHCFICNNHLNPIYELYHD